MVVARQEETQQCRERQDCRCRAPRAQNTCRRQKYPASTSKSPRMQLETNRLLPDFLAASSSTRRVGGQTRSLLRKPSSVNASTRQSSAMDVVLDQLWEIANEDDDPGSTRRDERIHEARALWRSLDVLLASASSSEFSVGDGVFTKMLACTRSVLSDVSYWSTSPPVDMLRESDFEAECDASVFACVNQVLDKVAGMSERERDALVRDGVADLIVRCVESSSPQQQLGAGDADDAATALQTLKTLVGDTISRFSLHSSKAIRACISLMQTHELSLPVQLRGCQFLQVMVRGENCKDRVVRHGGLKVVTNALMRFPGESKLAPSALDTMRSLCWEVRDDGGSTQIDPRIHTSSAALCDVATAVVKSMRAQQDAELVQIIGIGVLNCVATQASMKTVLCSLDIWDLAMIGLVKSSGAIIVCGFVELLDVMMRDEDTFATMRDTLIADSSPLCSSGVVSTRLIVLKDILKELQDNPIAGEMCAPQVAFISTQVQILLAEAASTSVCGDDLSGITTGHPKEETDTRNLSVRSQLFTSNDTEQPPTLREVTRHNEDELPVDTGSTTDGYASRDQSGDTEGLLLGDNAGYFGQFLGDIPNEGIGARPVEAYPRHESLVDHSLLRRPEMTDDRKYGTFRQGSPHHSFDRERGGQREDAPGVEVPTNSIATESSSDLWRGLYEVGSCEADRSREALRELEERYCIVLRRSQEQAKLLALQNTRINNHAEEHQQVIRRMRALEASLDDAEQRCNVERALRSAETTQCEQLSLALHQAAHEVQTLTAQQFSMERQLWQKESMRTEYMLRTRESKQDQRRIEVERDNAQLQMQLLQQEKENVSQELENCRQEGHESLLMREEDVDARRPGIFSELAKPTTTWKANHGCRSSLGVSRRSSLPSQALIEHVMETTRSTGDTSPLQTQTASVFPMRTNTNDGDKDLNDDPETIGRPEIESCLVSVFQSLNTSVDGSGETDVHVSSVRRFFLECGLVQPPQVQPADVDVVLARVLAQSQLNRKNAPVRKDFSSAESTWAPPQGWAKNRSISKPERRSATLEDAKRFRVFDQEAFNEATTLIGMRRFPRCELLRVLQTVVALYFHPYLRQLGPSRARQRDRFSLSCGTTRRPSTSSAGASSPSAVCNRALRAILNGLALHVGNDSNVHDIRRPSTGADLDEGESRYHSNLPLSLRRRYKREDVVYSMLEMQTVLSRELRPLGTICEFYSAQHLPNAAPAAAVAIVKEELFGLSFELLLSFSMDFELIPSFMDRVSLKHLHSEVAGLLKAYFALNNKGPPGAADAETLKKVAFAMVLARLALELFGAKPDYETPERQITALLQWLDNSAGREKLIRKSHLPVVIRFSRQLYALKH